MDLKDERQARLELQTTVSQLELEIKKLKADLHVSLVAMVVQLWAGRGNLILLDLCACVYRPVVCKRRRRRPELTNLLV